ncbi:MAG TPA: transglutaminase family protein [Methylibium sp.]|nr:transglutaminase family protein [Methylibium sp.]
MTTELEVRHETVYTYGQPVELAHHIAFLRPRDDGPQRLLDFALDIDPAPPSVGHETDAFGNTRTLFSLHAPHDALRVTARSRVQVSAPAEPDPGPDAPAAREHWRYQAGRAPDGAAGFVFASPLVPLADELRDWALPSFAPGRPLAEAATELMQRLHEEFAYEPDSTHVGTPLLEAFRERRGVCQDFAHVMIGALRSLGLAARYVSGYLLTEPPPGQPRMQGADASHAWLAVALPREDGEPDWLELDPTNACVAGASHVRVAFGRDYGDVTPLRGVIRGGGAHRLAVAVETRTVGGG